MRPPVVDQDLHLVDQTLRAWLSVRGGIFSLPLSYSAPDPALFEPYSRCPAAEAIRPNSDRAADEGWVGFARVNRVVCSLAVADADTGIQPDAVCGAERIVGVDETAFGALEVVFC